MDNKWILACLKLLKKYNSDLFKTTPESLSFYPKKCYIEEEGSFENGKEY